MTQSLTKEPEAIGLRNIGPWEVLIFKEGRCDGGHP
jgi:hypothetical protein